MSLGNAVKNRPDVAEFLDNDRLECLICCKDFKSLGTHIVRGHGISVSEYRAMFDIPDTVGLVGKGTRLLLSTHMLISIKNGVHANCFKPVYSLYDMLKFIDCIKMGHTYQEIEKMPGLPSRQAFHQHCSKDTSLRSMLDDAIVAGRKIRKYSKLVGC